MVCGALVFGLLGEGTALSIKQSMGGSWWSLWGALVGGLRGGPSWGAFAGGPRGGASWGVLSPDGECGEGAQEPAPRPKATQRFK